MRGLEQIKHLNENPHEARRDDAIFAPRDSRETQRLHGERVEARQRQNDERPATGHSDPLSDLDRSHRASTKSDLALRLILNDLIGGNPNGAAAKTVDLIGSLLVEDAVNKTVRTLADRPRVPSNFLGMDGIHSAIDADLPFLTFWAKLNDERAARGEGEARYREAKEAFNGGATPSGALTFIGKDWDGTRAIPAAPVAGHKAYRGEFRQKTKDGNTVWRVVANNTDGPISYGTPEAALEGARRAKSHSEINKS